jgi:hypothetical protein
MKPSTLKLLLVALCAIVVLPLATQAQNLTGIWRGYFITEGGEQYKYELQVDQTRKNGITGVSYSYLDTRFYGKATLVGNFNRQNTSALIQETKTIELKMQGGSAACIMKCFFTYARSGKEEFLEGSFQSLYEKAEPAIGIKRGGDCGGGKVYLRKVVTSDFYVEPFLRNKIALNKPEPKVPKPIPARPQPRAENKPLARTPAKPNLNKTEHPVATIPKPDTAQRRNAPPVVMEKPIEKPKVIIPQAPVVTRSRQNELVQTLIVTHAEISVRLYDNGEVDGDTVSVYLDGKPLVMNKGLSTVPISLTIKIDESIPEHTLVMYAENMGRIPPNTSLMIVQDGDKRYQVNITSTEQKNAMVRFRYQKDPG